MIALTLIMLLESFVPLVIDAASLLIRSYWFKICSSLIVLIWVFRLDCLLKCFPEKLTRFFDGLGFKGTEYAHPCYRLMACVLAPYYVIKRTTNPVLRMCRLGAINRLGASIGINILILYGTVWGGIYMTLDDQNMAMEVWKVSFYLIVMPITAALSEVFLSSCLHQFSKDKMELFWWIHLCQAVVFVSTVLPEYGLRGLVPPVIPYLSQFTLMYFVVLIRLSTHVNDWIAKKVQHQVNK